MAKPFWSGGTIIRNRITGKPLKVIRHFEEGVMVVDLEAKGINPPLILLERDFPDWIAENKLTSKEKKTNWYEDGLVEWALA